MGGKLQRSARIARIPRYFDADGYSDNFLSASRIRIILRVEVSGLSCISRITNLVSVQTSWISQSHPTLLYICQEKRFSYYQFNLNVDLRVATKPKLRAISFLTHSVKIMDSSSVELEGNRNYIYPRMHKA